MQTEAPWRVNISVFCHNRQLRGLNLARNFVLRQGLWIEDRRTPPGQECSNGSLILLAVVLWRALNWAERTLARAAPADVL